MDKLRPDAGDLSDRRPREGSVRWYLDNADEKIFEGSPATVRQTCYALLWLKRKASMTCSGLDILCKLLKNGLVKDGKHVPR